MSFNKTGYWQAGSIIALISNCPAVTRYIVSVLLPIKSGQEQKTQDLLKTSNPIYVIRQLLI